MATTQKTTQPEQPTNKVFELVDYLFEKIANMKTYVKAWNKYMKLKDEHCHLGISSRHPLSDKRAYEQKRRELEAFAPQFDKIITPYKNKVEELGYKQVYGSWKTGVKEIIDNWYCEVTDVEVAKKMLKECRKKIDILSNEQIDENLSIKRFLNYAIGNLFFGDLIEVMQIEFREALQSKFAGIARDLEPYFSNVTDEVIESIIEYKKQPHRARKPIAKARTYAIVFGDAIGIKPSELTHFFTILKDDRPVEHDFTRDRPKSETAQQKSLKNVLFKYLPLAD